LFGSPAQLNLHFLLVSSASVEIASGSHQERGGPPGQEQRGGCGSGGPVGGPAHHLGHQLTGIGLPVAERQQNVSRIF